MKITTEYLTDYAEKNPFCWGLIGHNLEKLIGWDTEDPRLEKIEFERWVK